MDTYGAPTPMELEPEEEEIAMATGGLGALRCLAEGGRRVCGERSRFRVRLNRKKWKMNRHFHILRGAGCRDVASSVVVVVRFNEHQQEDEATRWFWNYHCQNQGACVIAIN